MHEDMSYEKPEGNFINIVRLFFFSISDVTWMFDEVEEDEEVEGTLKSFAKMFRIKQI